MSRVIVLFLLSVTCQLLHAQKECSSSAYALQLAGDPAVREKMTAADNFLRSYRPEILSSGSNNASSPVEPVILIPVVVHILYKEAGQDVSDEMVKQQIDELNRAFRLQDADTNKIPAYFRQLAADSRIQFALAKVDPQGRATKGIIRKNTWVTMYGTDDRIKFSGQGGDDAWDRDKYLNVWVGNLVALVGYSSPIGGPGTKDGVVIRTDAFGVTGRGVYGGGKTLVHEVGHWLGLRHIWGDADCGDDLVDDTPKQRTANRGCPSGIKLSCDNAPYGDMYMNYMDQVNDDCMVMFTKGQVARMRSGFAYNGPRYAILSSNGCTGTPVSGPVESPALGKIVSASLSLYPNPAQKQLMINFNGASEITGSEAMIVNQFGQLVKRIRLDQLQTVVDISALQSGIYFLNVVRGKTSYQQKFIKL